MTSRRLFQRTLFFCACAALAALPCGCRSTSPQAALERFAFSRPEMGMPFRIVLYAPDALTAGRAATNALDRVRALNQVFSDYEDDSELSQLSRTAGRNQAVPVSPPLWNVLAQAQELSRLSDGAFDITAGPMVQLWRRARRQQSLPRPELLARARQAVGHNKLILDPKHHTALLQAPGMRLDLGAIAKGYAVDQAMKVLKESGIKHALIQCGGDMLASEAPPGQPGWHISLGSPEGAEHPPTEFVYLRRGALATSGDLFQAVEIQGVRYSHIVDPRTGWGLTDHSQVHVVAPTCAQADSLSTTLSVLGPEKGLSLAASLPRVGAQITRRPGSILETHLSARFPVRHRIPESSASVP